MAEDSDAERGLWTSAQRESEDSPNEGTGRSPALECHPASIGDEGPRVGSSDDSTILGGRNMKEVLTESLSPDPGIRETQIAAMRLLHNTGLFRVSANKLEAMLASRVHLFVEPADIEPVELKIVRQIATQAQLLKQLDLIASFNDSTLTKFLDPNQL